MAKRKRKSSSNDATEGCLTSFFTLIIGLSLFRAFIEVVKNIYDFMIYPFSAYKSILMGEITLKETHFDSLMLATVIWVVIISLLLLPICILLHKKLFRKKPAQNNIIPRLTTETVMTMSGEAYESYVVRRLRVTGYINVRTTPASGDYGVDILAHKDGYSYAIQCKKYSNSPVGVHAVMEAHSGKDYYGCQRAMVITTSSFTRQAINMANDLGVILVSNYR